MSMLPWFGSQEEEPKWKLEFEDRIREIQDRTGLSKGELRRVAEAIEYLKIIRL